VCIYIKVHNVQSNIAKFFIVNVNQKGNMFRLFLVRPHPAVLGTSSIYIYIYI
jgi:hypothetical protein